MINKITKKVTNQALQIGKRNYVVDESEEIKLKFDVRFQAVYSKSTNVVYILEKF